MAYLSLEGGMAFARDGYDASLRNPWDKLRLEVVRHVVDRMLLPRFIKEAKEELLRKSQVRREGGVEGERGQR